MTDPDLRHALRLLDNAIPLLHPRQHLPARVIRRRLRQTSLAFALLRIRLGQPAPARQRN
jgi:hypothetical protein